MTTTKLPQAPASIPPGCYRNDDGSLGWFSDQGYYNAMCDGWDNSDAWESYLDGFTIIGVGPAQALVLESADHCNRDHATEAALAAELALLGDPPF